MTVSPRRILVAAVAAQAAISFAEQGIPTLTVFVEEDLGLSAAGAGAVVSMTGLGRFAGFFAAGVLVDRRGERRVLLVGSVGTGVSLAIAAVLPFAGLLALCFVAGLFLATPAPAGGKLVHTAFPGHRRGLAMGIRQAAVPAGGLGAAALLPVVAATSSWRAAFVVAGVVAAAGGVVAVLLAGLGPRVEAAPRRARHALATFLTRDFVLVTVWAFVLVGGQYATVTFLAIDARERAGVSAAAAASLLLVVQASGMLGRVGWGLVADRVPALARCWLPAGLTLAGAASVLALAALPVTHLAAFALVALVIGFSVNAWQGLWMSRVTELAGTTHAGAATGISLTFLAVSITVSPPAYGAVADAAGSMRALWAVLGVLLALSSLAVVATSERA